MELTLEIITEVKINAYIRFIIAVGTEITNAVDITVVITIVTDKEIAVRKCEIAIKI